MVAKSRLKNGTDVVRRVLLAFDLSNQAGRDIVNATLTMTTRSGITVSGTDACTIYAWEGQTPVYDEANWSTPSAAAGVSWNGAAFTSGDTGSIDWPRAANTTFTSGDISDVIKSHAGGMVYLVIKLNDETVMATDSRDAIGHDEDDEETVVANLPTLNITSTVDHRGVFTNSEMTKYMNKSRGLVGKSSIPSITKQ